MPISMADGGEDPAQGNIPTLLLMFCRVAGKRGGATAPQRLGELVDADGAGPGMEDV